MTKPDYDYGVSTADVEPVLLEPTLERALRRLERLQPKYSEPLVIWRRKRPEWERMEENAGTR